MVVVNILNYHWICKEYSNYFLMYDCHCCFETSTQRKLTNFVWNIVSIVSRRKMRKLVKKCQKTKGKDADSGCWIRNVAIVSVTSYYRVCKEYGNYCYSERLTKLLNNILCKTSVLFSRRRKHGSLCESYRCSRSKRLNGNWCVRSATSISSGECSYWVIAEFIKSTWIISWYMTIIVALKHWHGTNMMDKRYLFYL